MSSNEGLSFVSRDSTGAAPPERDHAQVIALPPALYGAAIVIGALFQVLIPRPLFASPLSRWIGGVLVALSFVLAGWGRRALERAGTTVNPYGSTSSIVTGGPYRYSRNPLYVAINVGYLGVALLMNSLWTLLLLVPLLVIMQVGVIAREERYLEEKFGDAYRAYRSRVRRWL